jgi:hypothetical protein
MSGSKQYQSSAHYKNPSRIIGIQFGMMSPEEIRKGVVEITSKNTYVGNKEEPGGLFDPRMGVLGLDILDTLNWLALCSSFNISKKL